MPPDVAEADAWNRPAEQERDRLRVCDAGPLPAAPLRCALCRAEPLEVGLRRRQVSLVAGRAEAPVQVPPSPAQLAAVVIEDRLLAVPPWLEVDEVRRDE